MLSVSRIVRFVVKPGTIPALQHSRTMSLLLNKGLINGEWVEALNKKKFDVFNPASGEKVGSVPDMGVEDTNSAIQAAYDRFQSAEWQNLTAKERSGLLKKWYQLLNENAEKIAQIMTSESGKPLIEARGESVYGNSFVEWFAEETRRIYGEIIPPPFPNRQMMLTKQPIGVAALITPWNFPHAMITRKAAAALAAGCTVVIKPAEDTPLTALAIAKLAEDAGFPKGAINVVTCSRQNAAAVGEVLCKSQNVAGVSFTGSTAVGKILYSHCAQGIKRLGLELGGNAPFIVFNSASVDKAVAGAMGCKFRNCGQTCISANRFLIQEDIYPAFVDKLRAVVEKLVVGDGKKDGVNLGPLINEAQFKKVSEIVEDAKSKGATILVGGRAKSDLGKLFYEPTIVSDVTPNMRMYNEEIFGPVVSLIKFKTEEEALTVANNTNSGLAGYFFSEDVSQIFRVARKIETGMVGINESAISCTEAAFGGVKESGLGREGSRHGIDEFVYTKYLCLGGLN
ncbi:succinate-semialdehyde dehydrogenase, mitochondrial [Phlebotomus argentipes]|uniref:succinate-semialdehyde dehydrogenase, mitochondrial n=1 Tax=Phlebotomus argentipes TaxID=94469 RepID=UPI002892B15B|nr:succinate-semialdehyde dehydrogenase, mitochondrial [Phlebotomus argentipes]